MPFWLSAAFSFSMGDFAKILKDFDTCKSRISGRTHFLFLSIYLIVYHPSNGVNGFASFRSLFRVRMTLNLILWSIGSVWTNRTHLKKTSDIKKDFSSINNSAPAYMVNISIYECPLLSCVVCYLILNTKRKNRLDSAIDARC